MDRVVIVNDLYFNVEDNEPARIYVGAGSYQRGIKVENVPGYRHDTALVAKMLAQVEALFPVKCEPVIYLTNYDSMGRFNGVTYHDYNYKKQDVHGRDEMAPGIVLFGKRVPPHPAMTRYLVAHEYGHVVEESLAQLRFTSKNPGEKMRAEYAELRGMKVQKHGASPGYWTTDPGEVFANDFRVYVCNIEPEFWPHEVPRPNDVPAVADWWKARLYEVAEARRREGEAASVRKDGEAFTALASIGASASP